MLKLVMISETHHSRVNVGSVITKFKCGNGPVRLLVEGQFLSQSEKDILGGKILPKTPSNMLLCSLKERMDINAFSTGQNMCLERWKIDQSDRVLIAPIEPAPLRAFIYEMIDPFRKFASNPTPGGAQNELNGFQGFSKREIDGLGLELGLLNQIITNWDPKNQLHNLEIMVMTRLYELMSILHNELVLCYNKNVDSAAVAKILSAILSKEKTDELVKDVLLNLRSRIQSYYSYLWISNSQSQKFDTLATITGIRHVPQIISDLYARLGEKLWSFSPVVILTDEDVGVTQELLKLGERLIIFKVK